MDGRDIVKIEFCGEACAGGGAAPRILAVADIHGCAAELDILLCRAQYRPGVDFLFILGDTIEKGADNLLAMERVFELSGQPRVVVLQGNNDRRANTLFDGDYDRAADYCRFRSDNTLTQFCKKIGRELSRESYAEICREYWERYGEIARWMDGLPLCAECGEFLFCHAGLWQDDWRATPRGVVLYDKGFARDGVSPEGYITVAGHMPVVYFDEDFAMYEPVIDMRRRVIVIDGGTVLGGGLNLFEIRSGENGWEYANYFEPVGPERVWQYDRPIAEAARGYAEGGPARFHMPGHKGRPAMPLLVGAGRLDVTELEQTGDLYGSDIFERSEGIASGDLFRVGAVCFSAGGSTLCIQAMMAEFFKRGDRVIIRRASHRAILNAMALLGIEAIFLPEPFCAANLAAALGRGGVAGVFLTSPDYYGYGIGVSKCAALCREHGVPLLVDQAHGAHFRVIRKKTAVSAGADAACVSLHKTLPAMTGAAAVLLADPARKQGIKDAMRLFGSSSPSFPILISAEEAVVSLHGDIFRWKSLQGWCEALCARFSRTFSGDDPTRILVDLSGTDNLPARFNLVPEYLGPDGVAIFITSPYNTKEELSRLESLCAAAEGYGPAPAGGRPDSPLAALARGQGGLVRAVGASDALQAPSERVGIDAASGRVCARPICLCPPCVVIADRGEVIDQQAVEFAKMTGITQADVLK